jgi:hypothetical protein
MAKSRVVPAKSEPVIKLPTEQDHELEFLMRTTGRSRVQVLNAIKVRGPSREAILRALAR